MDLPTLNLPAINLPSDVYSLANDDIEQYALDLRSYWDLGDGPISDLTLTMENNGVLVARTTMDADTLDAFSQMSATEKRAYVFLASDKESGVRSRYDAGHECGHLILHPNVKTKDINSKLHHKILETQAFRFASAFHLPASTFTRDLWSPSIDAFISLKERWRVSVGVMIKRCQELELIDEEETRRMWINYVRRGYKKREPLDEKIAIESPRLVRRGFELLVNEGIRTKDQILMDLPFAPGVIEELAGLTRGYLTGRTAEDEVLPVLKAEGNVIQFQRS